MTQKCTFSGAALTQAMSGLSKCSVLGLRINMFTKQVGTRRLHQNIISHNDMENNMFYTPVFDILVSKRYSSTLFGLCGP